jgi:putative ABC transport system permease protein
MLTDFLYRLRALFRRKSIEAEMSEELRVHLDHQTEKYLRAGLSAEEAARRARLDLGGLDQVKEECRDSWGVRFINEVAQDLRYGLRQLRRNPGFTIVAVITLALGIGANTAIFSVVNGVLLNPLPYSEPSRLVVLYSQTDQFPRSSISYPDFLDWARDNRSFSALAAYRADDFDLTGAGEPERVPAEMVSASFFPLLGVKPVIGRLFTPGEDRVGAAPIVLISAGLWKRRFATSPDVVGKSITLGGADYTIIGVIPADFHYYDTRNFLYRTDVYVPIGQWNDLTFRNRGAGMGTDAIGRLRPGVKFLQAKADMDALAAHLAEEYPKADKGKGVALFPLKQDVVGSVQPDLLMLLAAVGFVLLIACVNVGNLSLARSATRSREFAIRIALGAGRSRVIRQLLAESTLLALAGGGLGLLLASRGLKAAVNLLPEALPRPEAVRLDMHVLLFTLEASVLAGILLGLAPALKSSSRDVQESLKEGSRGSTGARHRAQSAFVVTEIALALVLLAGAGLMIRSLSKLWSVSPGFDPRNVLTFGISLPAIPQNPDAIRTAWLEMRNRLASVPGVKAASLTLAAKPMGSDSETSFWLEGQPKPVNGADMKETLLYLAQPDYLKVMRIPLESGRFLRAEDNQHAPLVTVIDEEFAKLYFPGQNPIGKRINFDFLSTPAEIVGVVGHIKQWGLDEGPSSSVLAQCYFTPSQLPNEFVPLVARYAAAVVRTAGSPLAEAGSLRQAMKRVSSQPVIYDVKTMDSIVADSVAARQLSMILMGIFAALALTMASIGVYGVISFLSRQRTHEIGIRIALGAGRSNVLKMVVGQGIKLVLIGVAIGIAGAFALTRFLSSLLYGVKPTDPLTFIAVSLILTAVALLACYIPARRAAKVDPMVALRYE